MTQNTQQHSYVDLHVAGFGFLNRVRHVKPTKGKPYWAVTVAAMRGDNKDKTYFDCIVVGDNVNALFNKHLSNLTKDDVVTASFKLGDLHTDTFTYSSGDKQGQTGFSLKARLFQVKYLKVNDQVLLTSQAANGQSSQEAA